MEDKIEIMNLLQKRQLLLQELGTLAYGSVEIRESNSKKYIYVHYREEGITLTKYVGEYSYDLYNAFLSIISYSLFSVFPIALSNRARPSSSKLSLTVDNILTARSVVLCTPRR